MARRSKKNQPGCLQYIIEFGFFVGAVEFVIVEGGKYIFPILLIILAVFILAKIVQKLKQKPPKAIQSKPEKQYDFIIDEKTLQLTQITVQTNKYVDDELRRIDVMDGRDFEFWCADLLRRCGYTNVRVTPGSGDQGADIICEYTDGKYAVQCKCYSTDLGNTPIQEITAATLFYDCDYGVVMTNRHFTPAARELANKIGVILIDRDVITDMLCRVSEVGMRIECPNCGITLPVNAKFCPECGCKIS